MRKFDNAKVGDKVFSTIYGWGEIVEVNKFNEEPPIIVKFQESGTVYYTLDGKYNDWNKFPTL